MNYILYELEVEHLSPFSILINHTSGFIKQIKVELIQQKNQLTDEMSIFFELEENVPSSEEVLELTREKAGDIVNLLFIKSNGRFGKPLLKSFSINGKTRAIASITIEDVSTQEVPANLDQELEGDLSDNKKLEDLRDSPLNRLYRAAMRVDDVTTRFMFLYGTLLASTPNELQSEVDALIKLVEPQVKLEPSTRPGAKPGDTQTKYSWLRNQVGHTKATTDLLLVEDEIKDVCFKFAEIVKKSIS